MSEHGQAAKDALEKPHLQKDDLVMVVRAARIVADAIDRLTVALTGTKQELDVGALGEISSSVDRLAERDPARGTSRPK